MLFSNKGRYWTVIIVGMMGVMMLLGVINVPPALADGECETHTVSRTRIRFVQTREAVRDSLTQRPLTSARLYLESDTRPEEVEALVCPMTEAELTAFLNEPGPYYILTSSGEQGATEDASVEAVIVDFEFDGLLVAPLEY